MLNILRRVQEQTGEHRAAAASLTEAPAGFRRLGDRRTLSNAVVGLGFRPDEAEALDSPGMLPLDVSGRHQALGHGGGGVEVGRQKASGVSSLSPSHGGR